MEAGDTVASPRVAGVKRKSSVSDGEHVAKASRSGGGSDGSKREKVEKILADALSVKEPGAESDDRQLIRQRAREVEEALYALCKGISTEYTEKAKQLKFNIANNKELREDILAQEIEADTLVSMKSTELADRNKKSQRETAKKESLQETINNDELKNLKNAAAGLSLRKTDAGLAVVDIEAEKAKKEEEERERRKVEEEGSRAAAAAAEKKLRTMIKIDITEDDENAYLTSAYTPTANGRAAVDSDDEDVNKKTELVIDSQEMEALDDLDEQDEHNNDVNVVWQGDLDCKSRKRAFLYPEQQGARPLRLSAFALQEGGELHNPIHQRLQVQGYISLGDMEKYIAAKRQTPELKMVLAYKFVPNSVSRAQYDTLVEELTKKKKGMCLIDDRNWGGLLYALPSTSPTVSSLLSYGEDDCLVAVAITDRHKRLPAPKRHQPDEIRQEVSNDFAKATGSQEKTVLLKLKKGSCSLRLRAISGDNELEQVPDELEDMSKCTVGDVINFLLTQKVSVMEVEPEREKDEEEHVKLIERLVAKQRAAVVLDTEKALMYLIPPIEEAGKLLNPPSSTCDNMLGVLLLSNTGESAGQASEDVGTEQKHDPAATSAEPAICKPDLVASGISQSVQSKEKIELFASHGAVHKVTQPENVPAGHHWQQSQDSPRVHPRVQVPAPVAGRQLPLGGMQQSSMNPSPRPAYDSMQSPTTLAPGPPPHAVRPPTHAAGPPAHAAGGHWGPNPQRGHEGGGGWQDKGGFQQQGRFLGENRQDQRQWRDQAGPNFSMSPASNFPPYPMGGGVGGHRSEPYNGFAPGPPQGMGNTYGGWGAPGQAGHTGRPPPPPNSAPYNQWRPGPLDGPPLSRDPRNRDFRSI